MFIGTISFGQNITVKDSASGKPIEAVLIYSNTNSNGVLSNKRGIVSLDNFSEDDLLTISHTAYANKFIKKKDIDLGKSLFLVQKENMLPELYVNHTLRYFLVESDEAAMIETIPIETVRLENPTTSADMLQNSGTVLVQKSQGGGGSPILRGFEANKVLLVIDGIRMNNAIYRSGHLQNSITVDNSILDQTEIIFGPSSSLYGSDALGGVIHFHTVDPKITNSDSLYFTGNSFVRYNTNNNLSGNFNFSMGKNKWGLLSSFTASKFNDTKMGTLRTHGYEEWGLHPFYIERINGVDSTVANPDPNVQLASGYTQFDILQKFIYAANDRLKFTFNFQYSTSTNINRYDQLTEYRDGQLRFAEWYYGPQRRLLGALKVDFQSNSNLFKNGVLTASYQQIDEDRIRRSRGSNWKEYQEEDLDIFGLNLDFNKVLTKRRMLFYGIEAQHNIVNSTAFERNILSSEQNGIQTRYPGNSHYLNGGAYVEYKQKFKNNNLLTSGLRYSFIYANSQFDNTSFVPLPFNEVNILAAAPSGNLGFVLIPNRKTRFKALLSTGFRAPNVDDYGKVFERGGVTVVPNDNVKPEYALGGELAFERTLGIDRVKIWGAAYTTYLFNALVQRDFILNGEDSIFYQGEMTKIQSTVNTDNAIVYGFSGSVRANITNDLTLTGTYNYTKGTDLSNATPLEHIAPQFGKIAFTYVKKNWNTSLFSLYNFRKKKSDYQDGGDNIDLTPNEDGTPPWWTLNYRVSYDLMETLTFQFAVDNILDLHYRQFASGISAPGRNFMVGVRAHF